MIASTSVGIMVRKRVRTGVTPRSSTNQSDEIQRQKNVHQVCYRCVGISAGMLFMMTVILWILPSPIDPVYFRHSEEECPSLDGALKINEYLKSGRKLFENEIEGPEAFAVDSTGNLYTGLADGRIIRISKDLLSYTQVATTRTVSRVGCDSLLSECARPLGMQFHHDHVNKLYVADSSVGLLMVDIDTGYIETLFSNEPTQGKPQVKFLNDLIVLQNGTVVFTDSSKKFGRVDNRLEVLESSDNGQLLYYNPSDGSVGLLQEGLFFPNGITLSADNNSILIVETTRARILRYHLSGPHAGTTDVFVDNLPGLPDNISPSLSGGYWVGFAALRSPLIDILAELPLFRLVIAKMHLMALIEPMIPRHGLVVEIDNDGNIIRSLHDEGGDNTHATSHIVETDKHTLIIGSYFAPFILKVEV